jgi:hypothetical protein
MELSNEYRRRNYPITPSDQVGSATATESVTKDKRKWAATESCVSFNFNNLLKKVKQQIKAEYPKATNEEINERIGRSLLLFTINEQTFKYLAIPNTLGGLRWFVCCPKCGKRSLRLFLPKNKDREPLYLCKDCHKLKPTSLLSGGCKKYKRVTRPLKRLEVITKKLLRKKISASEAEKLLEEYDRIEKKLADSPEYRLWKFKKEHGRLV